MTSEKQIEANRQNAQKSTGPRTPAGKATVAMNPLVHGLRAKRIVLPAESEDDFRQLCADLETTGAPKPAPSNSCSKKWLSPNGSSRDSKPTRTKSSAKVF